MDSASEWDERRDIKNSRLRVVRRMYKLEKLYIYSNFVNSFPPLISSPPWSQFAKRV